LRQHNREGQEDLLGALGLLLSLIVPWNTIYMEAALDQLRREGYRVQDDDVARLSPLMHEHINMLGRYALTVPEAVAKGDLRPLRDPADADQHRAISRPRRPDLVLPLRRQLLDFLNFHSRSVGGDHAYQLDALARGDSSRVD
jgi:hypothetical protein